MSVGSSLIPRVLHTLQVIDIDWCRDGPDLPWLSTRLCGYGACELYGDVVHWLRPPSPLSAARSERRELIEIPSSVLLGTRAQRRDRARSERLPPAPAAHPVRALHRLAMVWNADPRQPRIEPWRAPRHMPQLVYGRDRVEKEGFRIALCPLLPNCYPTFRLTEDRKLFQTRGSASLHNADALMDHLKEILRVAREQQIDLVVLPELSVDKPRREKLREILESQRSRWPAGVVAGSFHIWDDEQEDPKSWPRNECRLLDNIGQTLLVHEKRGRFRLTPTQLLEIGQKFFPGESLSMPEGVQEPSSAPNVGSFNFHSPG